MLRIKKTETINLVLENGCCVGKRTEDLNLLLKVNEILLRDSSVTVSLLAGVSEDNMNFYKIVNLGTSDVPIDKQTVETMLLSTEEFSSAEII